MTIALVPPESGRLSWGVRPSGAWIGPGSEHDPARLTRFAAACVLAYSVFLPVIALYRLVAAGAEPAIPAAATTCYLPVVVWLVWAAVRGTRPRAAGWILAGLAVGVLVTLPVIGVGWLAMLEPMAGLVLLAIRWPWSLLAFAAVAAAPAALASALGHPDLDVISTVDVLLAGALIAVPVWLVGAIDHLRGARLELARAAVVRERLRIDDELRLTLGTVLETITAAADHASRLAAGNPAAAEAELRILAGASRTALAESRQLVRDYRQPSMVAELQAAATLLSAADIETRLELPPGVLPAVMSAAHRSQLQSELARLLRQDAPGRYVIAVARQHGQVRLDVRADSQAGARSGDVR